jgi:hypothetical protein
VLVGRNGAVTCDGLRAPEDGWLVTLRDINHSIDASIFCEEKANHRTYGHFDGGWKIKIRRETIAFERLQRVKSAPFDSSCE